MESRADLAIEALVQARESDQQLWSTLPGKHGSSDHREARDAAVLRALQAGVPPRQLADELGVLVVDIERMAVAAGGERRSAATGPEA